MRSVWKRRPPDVAAAVDEELRFHFAERVAALVEAGHSPEAAGRIARDEFGDPDEVRRALTEIDARIATRRRRADVIGALVQDLRHAVRALAAAPRFTLLVIAVLALGIGASATLFTVIDRLFLRAPAGIAEPSDLIRLYRRIPINGRPVVTRAFHYPGYRDVEAALGAAITAYIDQRVPMGRGETPELASVAWIGPRYFQVLGVGPPALGRYPSDDELRVDRPTDVAVISYAAWQARFGGEAGVLGSRIELARQTFTVIGVAARGFAGPDLDAVSFWLPLGSVPWRFTPPWHQARNVLSTRAIVRSASRPADEIARTATAAFRAGAPAREATTEMLAGPLLEARGPMAAPEELTISTRLSAVAAAVLLIAAANVVNLLLGRAMSRRREISLRLALGISRGRLASLFLLETLVLSAAAAAAALVVTTFTAAAIRRMLLPEVEWIGPAVDLRICAFAFGLAALVAVFSSVPVAARARRDGMAGGLTAGGRASARTPLRSMLVVTQVALSMMLLLGAAAFVRSLLTAQAVRTGYDVDRLLLVTLRYDDGQPRRDETARHLQELMQRLRSHPAVERVALSGMRPLSGYAMSQLFRPDGAQIPNADELQPSSLHVTPGFFQTAGIAVERGRGFDERDTAGAPPVMVINRSMAQTLWPNEDPIGKCIRIGTAARPCVTVIGVVANTNRDGLIEEVDGRAPLYFIPAGQGRSEFAAPAIAVVRIAGAQEARDAAGLLRGDLRGMLPEGVYATVTPMRETFAGELRAWTLGASLFTAFGLLALAVAAVGTYSTIAYLVAQRWRELGIRVALGASPGRLRRLVASQGLVPVIAGIWVGLGVAALIKHAIEPLLYRTSVLDPSVVTAAGVTMLAAAAAGCLLPARRAAAIDPVAALKLDS